MIYRWQSIDILWNLLNFLDEIRLTGDDSDVVGDVMLQNKLRMKSY